MTFGCKKVLPFQPIENKTASSQTKQIPFWLWFFIRAADGGDVFLNNAAAPCAFSHAHAFPFQMTTAAEKCILTHVLFFSLKQAFFFNTFMVEGVVGHYRFVEFWSWKAWVFFLKMLEFFSKALNFFSKTQVFRYLKFEQVKPGFTNYQPRGLGKQILNFKPNQKLTKICIFLNFEKNNQKSQSCLKFD